MAGEGAWKQAATVVACLIAICIGVTLTARVFRPKPTPPRRTPTQIAEGEARKALREAGASISVGKWAEAAQHLGRLRTDFGATRVCADRARYIDTLRRGLEAELHDQASPPPASDWIDLTADENLEKPTGRGVMLMRAYMDEVRFNDKGNEVHLVKRNT